MTKLSLKHKHTKETLDDFTKSCNDLANSILSEPVKDFKPEVIDERAELYKSLKKSIDEGKPIMYIDLSEEK